MISYWHYTFLTSDDGVTSYGFGIKMNEKGKTKFYPMQLLPTPTASSCAKGGCTRKDPKRQNDTLACAIHSIFGERGKSSQLNPLFVQEMMGFPYLWTELPFQCGEQNQSKAMVTR